MQHVVATRDVLAVKKEDALDITYETEDGTLIELREYIGRVETLSRGPQAFVSSQPPGFVIPPHYHLSDQCQVFVEGSGTMYGHVEKPVTVHYADKFTAYGPIDCGDEGLSFFNFRARCDVGAEWMPEARKGIALRGGREIKVQARLNLADAVGPLRLETLIDLHDDGLAVYEMVAGEGSRLLEGPVAGTGRFELILDGDIECGGTWLSRHSVGFVAAGESFGRRVAGPDGVHLIEIQFPRE
jgi:hypothetical protein